MEAAHTGQSRTNDGSPTTMAMCSRSRSPPIWKVCSGVCRRQRSSSLQVQHVSARAGLQGSWAGDHGDSRLRAMPNLIAVLQPASCLPRWPTIFQRGHHGTWSCSVQEQCERESLLGRPQRSHVRRHLGLVCSPFHTKPVHWNDMAPPQPES